MKKLKTFLLLSMIAVFVMGMTVSAAGSVKLALTPDKTTLSPGDTVTVTLSVEENTGLGSLGARVEYDKNVFTPVEKSISGFLPDNGSRPVSQDQTEKNLGVVWLDLGNDLAAENYIGTGAIAAIKFQVNENVSSGSTQIKIKNTTQVLDADIDDVAFNEASTTLTITGGVCEHKLTKVAAVSATCDKAGNKEYYKCSECGKLFTDAEGKSETTIDAVTIAALGHKMTKTAAVAATCEKDGNIEYYTCSVCKNIYKDAEGKTKITSADTIVKATGHKLTKVVAAAATCDKAGNKEYYKCSECGKLFEDAAGKTETTLEKVTVAASGHKLTKVAAVAATCDKAGNKEYYKCSECGKLFEDAAGKTETTLEKVTVAATGHSWDEGKVTKEATATTDGEITYTCKNDSKHTKTETFKEKTKDPVATSVTTFSDSTATTKLSTELAKKADYDKKNIAYYDITMKVSLDNGKTYVPVTAETMPKEGVKVRIPYPAGTNSSYDFVVLHLLADGTVETLNPEKTSENLIVTAKSLSPFAVGYKEGEEDDDDDDDEITPVASSTSTGTANNGTITSPKTGDVTGSAMWILIACASVTILFGTAYGYKNKRK